jgi:hypothetical protein
MGYQRGDIAVVIGWETSGEFEECVSAINREWGERDIITRSGPHVNGYLTWVFNYDGSKEGWTDSERADDLRLKFMQAAVEHLRWPDIVQVCVGVDSHDDDFISRVYLPEDDEE